ncbi:receptor-like protein kinase FERONIA [Cinnamomum micranthum f. kanehirae]|uniref:Receptor-like protein kinase FERONIA n=1 Tax=Cinnamomum micranthum f. kanehirae TaxID=337451 RepID=A0A443Q4V9_9MAGN|nr:receptor-like protein kinase FERONIA [Cinnamomum micranthum f. kanehirae]
MSCFLSFSSVFFSTFFNGFSGISAANDLILLNCGSAEDGIDADNRKWYGDSSSKFLLSSSGSSQEKAEFQDPSLPSESLIWKQHIGFQPHPEIGIGSDSISTLHRMVGEMNPIHSSLLHLMDHTPPQFSAAITAKALTLAYIMREFSLSPIHDSIHLTFAPSDKHSAFLCIHQWH